MSETLGHLTSYALCGRVRYKAGDVTTCRHFVIQPSLLFCRAAACPIYSEVVLICSPLPQLNAGGRQGDPSPTNVELRNTPAGRPRYRYHFAPPPRHSQPDEEAENSAGDEKCLAGPASRSVIRYWSSDLFTVELIALKLEPLKIDKVLCYVKFFQLNSSDTQSFGSTPNKQFKKNFFKLLTFKKKIVFLIKFL